MTAKKITCFMCCREIDNGCMCARYYCTSCVQAVFEPEAFIHRARCGLPCYGTLESGSIGMQAWLSGAFHAGEKVMGCPVCSPQTRRREGLERYGHEWLGGA